MASEIDSLQDTLQASLEGAFNTGACPYDKVAALVLYWAEDDFNPSCAEEAKKVVDLFRTDLQYEVQTFPIPMSNSRNLLEQAVVNFKCINDGESSLLIIYYSGHADPDEKRGKAVWAAYVKCLQHKSFFYRRLSMVQETIWTPNSRVVRDPNHASIYSRRCFPHLRLLLCVARYQKSRRRPFGAAVCGGSKCPNPATRTIFLHAVLRRRGEEGVPRAKWIESQ